ncbi:MAG: ABC transporter substrate-binding protein [Micavibrio sp.]|nr:ABC transporter substrate-binding protein [Micavibrio sp.]
MMTTRFHMMLAGLALAFITALPGLALAKGPGSDTPAAAFVQGLGDKALTSLTAKDLPAAERAERVRTLLRTNFDVPTIARFVLGRGWNTATDAQRKEYMKLFEDMIVKTYTKRFADYSGQAFKVLGSKSLSDTDSLVSSQILQNDGPAVQVDWRVRGKGGQLKVVDVVVEQISMSVTQRSDFESIMGGSGDVETLLKSLRTRAAGTPKK